MSTTQQEHPPPPLLFSDDVLHHLLSFLDPQSMLLKSGCFRVCKQWNNIVRSIPIDLVLERYQLNRLLSTTTTTTNTNSIQLNIRSLELNQAISPEDLNRIPHCSPLSTVQKLKLSGGVMNYSSLIHLLSAGGGSMNNVTDVTFVGSVDKKALKSIVPTSSMKSLKSLTLNGSVDDLLIAMSQSEYYENLTCLDLDLASYTDKGICALVGSRSTVKNLTSLSCESSQLSTTAISGIANSPNMKNLTKLNLGYNYKGVDGIKNIAQSEYMANLKILHIPSGVEYFTDPNSKVPNLTKLKIMGEQLNENVIEIAKCSHMNHLEKLGRYFGTSTSNMKESGDRALAESSYVTKLKKYYLEFDDGDEPTMFLSSPNCSQVKSIHGSINSIKMMKSVTESPYLKNLISFHIYGEVGDDAFQLLSQSENVRKLQSLSYSFVGEGELPSSQLVYHLVSSDYLNNLVKLKLSKVNIGLDGMKSLLSSRLMSKTLRSLNLEQCNIDREIVEELFKSEQLQNITSLSLNYNDGISGSIHTFLTGTTSQLKSLSLANCSLIDEDVLHLSQCKHLKNLRSLNLKANSLSHLALKHLFSSEYLIKLSTIDVFRNDILIDQDLVDFVAEHAIKFTNLSFLSLSRKGKNFKEMEKRLESIGISIA